MSSLEVKEAERRGVVFKLKVEGCLQMADKVKLINRATCCIDDSVVFVEVHARHL